jgi:hypothetical protein
MPEILKADESALVQFQGRPRDAPADLFLALGALLEPVVPARVNRAKMRGT